MDQPSVSILLPAYNHACFLGQAIQSVSSQTFGDFELIIVNDGSTDDTEKIAKGFDDVRLHYLAQPNGGVAAALNTAFRASRGAYLGILNDDDVWLPTTFYYQNHVVAYYRQHASNTSGVNASRFELYQQHRLQVLDKFFADPTCPPLAKQMKAIAYRNLYLAIGLQWLHRGNPKRSIECFGKSLRAAPSAQTIWRISGYLLFDWASRFELGRSWVSRYSAWTIQRRRHTRDD